MLLKSRLIGVFSILVLLSVPDVFAQPSGGPYGPVRQTYQVPVGGTKYFVSPDGRPDASGKSISDPTTIQSAVERVRTGDAIILRGGNYRTGDLFINQGITIQPYQDEQPVLKGTLVADDWVPLKKGLWKAHWKHLFPAQPESWWRREREEKHTPLSRFNNDMVFVDGRFLQSVGTRDEVDEETFYIDYENGLVYIGTDPANRVVEITAFDCAITRTTEKFHGKKSDKKGPVIRGITFTQYAYRALEFEGIDPDGISAESEHGKEIIGTTLENCEISFGSRVGGYFRGDHLTIRNCLISDTSTEGIFILNSSDVLLEKNIFQRNNIERITGYYPAAVKIFNQCYRVVCRDNLVIDQPYSNGIWYDVGNVDGVILNNWFERVGLERNVFSAKSDGRSRNAFFFEISKGAICAGNVFVDCDRGINIYNSSDVQLYNNTFVNSQACFGRTTRGMGNDHFGWHPSTGPTYDERDGHVFANNLMYGNDRFENPLLSIWQSSSLNLPEGQPQVKQLDHNLYVRSKKQKEEPLIYLSPPDVDRGNSDYRSLELVRKQYPEVAAHSQELISGNKAFFKSIELTNLQLMDPSIHAKAATALPKQIKVLLDRTESLDYVGAYQSEN